MHLSAQFKAQFKVTCATPGVSQKCYEKTLCHFGGKIGQCTEMQCPPSLCRHRNQGKGELCWPWATHPIVSREVRFHSILIGILSVFARTWETSLENQMVPKTIPSSFDRKAQIQIQWMASSIMVSKMEESWEQKMVRFCYWKCSPGCQW